jgi:transaldolase
LPAIRALIGEGINVNVTLIFGVERWREVADAYLSGLEDLAAKGRPLERVASVASFFVSRIDSMVDPLLEQAAGRGASESDAARRLRGRAAIACSKLAYQSWRELHSGARFKGLAGKGARHQRLLWASTSTKNPADSDVKYMDALVGPDTVDTAPMETLDAYRDHGRPEPRLAEGLEEAGHAVAELAWLGVLLPDVAARLEEEGIHKFNQPFDAMLASLARHQAAQV